MAISKLKAALEKNKTLNSERVRDNACMVFTQIESLMDQYDTVNQFA